MAIDPVCGMTVDEPTAKATAEHSGVTYNFCCQGCAQKFKAQPDHYLQPKPRQNLITIGAPKPKSAPAVHADSSAYVCPMCPEVRSSSPGPCPSCGMALEPELPQLAKSVEYTCPMHPEVV